MARRILLLGCLITVIMSSGVAEAQRRTPGYRNRPTISPFISLFRGDNAGLNSYFNVVRPQQMLNSYMRESDYEFAAQQQLIDQRSVQLQQELDQSLQGGALQQRPTSGTGNAIRRPPGTFMNYSSFFRGGVGGGATGGARSRR